MVYRTPNPTYSAALMRAMDGVSARYGQGTLRSLATGVAQPWGTRATQLTQRYTTHSGKIMQAQTQ